MDRIDEQGVENSIALATVMLNNELTQCAAALIHHITMRVIKEIQEGDLSKFLPQPDVVFKVE